MTDFELQALVTQSIVNVVRAEQALAHAQLQAVTIASYAVSRLCPDAPYEPRSGWVVARSVKTDLMFVGRTSGALWNLLPSKNQFFPCHLEPHQRFRIGFIRSAVHRKSLVPPPDSGLTVDSCGGRADNWAACVEKTSSDALLHETSRPSAWSPLDRLTPRQRQIMDLVLSGKASKSIAFALGISQRTVENHRASIMKKTRSGSIPALARLAFAANAGLPFRDEATPAVRSAA